LLIEDFEHLVDAAAGGLMDSLRLAHLLHASEAYQLPTTSHQGAELLLFFGRLRRDPWANPLGEPSMEGTLSCGCELVAGAQRPLWRLFGLIPRDRRQSSFSTASFVAPRGGRSAAGRDEACCAAHLVGSLIELEEGSFGNIQEGRRWSRGKRGLVCPLVCVNAIKNRGAAVIFSCGRG
jgi:hypothetical protein